MHGDSTPTPLTTRDDSIAIDTLDELFYFGATNGLLMMQLLFLFACLLFSISVDEVIEIKHTSLHADFS